MLKVTSTQSPAIFRARNGHRYIIGGTVLAIDGIALKHGSARILNPNITVDDLVWIRPIKSTRVNSPLTTKQVAGSHGHVYTVTIQNGRPIRCTCLGFSYRRKCKHLLG